ncbi:MAG: hydrogenase/urease maturation nickel metallochaperone HypA [Dehalococcoidales bacterium]
MHESLLVKELLDEISRLAREQPMAKITKVRVSLGKDGHTSPESLRLHFEEQSQRTVAEGANLEVESVPGDSLFLVSLEGE